jgi:hypothetical protein
MTLSNITPEEIARLIVTAVTELSITERDVAAFSTGFAAALLAVTALLLVKITRSFERSPR